MITGLDFFFVTYVSVSVGKTLVVQTISFEFELTVDNVYRFQDNIPHQLLPSRSHNCCYSFPRLCRPNSWASFRSICFRYVCPCRCKYFRWTATYGPTALWKNGDWRLRPSPSHGDPLGTTDAALGRGDSLRMILRRWRQDHSGRFVLRLGRRGAVWFWCRLQK